MERALRFCMITTFYPPYNFGGDGIFVQRLSNELAKRGHMVDVVHCVDSYRLLAGREPGKPYADHPNVTVFTKPCTKAAQSRNQRGRKNKTKSPIASREHEREHERDLRKLHRRQNGRLYAA